LLLFFSYFSIRARLTVRKIPQFGHTIDYSIKSVKSRRSYYPLLYYDHQPVPGIRGRDIELLLSSNITLKFKDTEHKETCLPDLSGQKWLVYKMPYLNKRGRIYRPYLILYSQLRESYFDYAFYKYHVKLWRRVAFF
jgi:hypothetical protein